MRRINGITVLFIFGIMSVLFGVSMMNKVYKKTPIKNTDNGSTMVRFGETFEDQMSMKARPDSFTIPLTIVTTPPEVSAQAHVTLGEQREEGVITIAIGKEFQKDSIYKRDIFIHYPESMLLQDLFFSGLKPTFKDLKSKAGAQELAILGKTMERYMNLRINNSKPIPVLRMREPKLKSTHLENLILQLDYPSDYGIFKANEKIKITIELFFQCTSAMVKNKSTYNLTLDDWGMYPLKMDSKIELENDLHMPIKDFFVIKCGE